MQIWLVSFELIDYTVLLHAIPHTMQIDYGDINVHSIRLSISRHRV